MHPARYYILKIQIHKTHVHPTTTTNCCSLWAKQSVDFYQSDATYYSEAVKFTDNDKRCVTNVMARYEKKSDKRKENIGGCKKERRLF